MDYTPMDDQIRNDSLKSSDRMKQEVCKEHTVNIIGISSTELTFSLQKKGYGLLVPIALKTYLL